MMRDNSKIQNHCLQPEEIVGRYYQLLYGGALQSLRELMTKKSYYMTLESLGIKLSFKDPLFKSKLENIEDDEDSLKEVEQQLSLDLLSRDLSPKINIEEVKANGSGRTTVHYTEDGKTKNLYFSKEDTGWKINYYAGCKAD